MQIHVAYIVLGLGAAFLVGWVASSWWELRRARRVQELRERERVESEAALAGLRREIAELRGRWQEQIDVFSTLPEILDEMFRAPSRRGIVPLVLKLLDALMKPEQAVVFVARPAQRKLAVAEGIGLPRSIPAGLEVDYGQGRVGYVAEHRVPMAEADFTGARGEKSTQALVKRQLAATELRDLRAEAVAAVPDGESVYLVLSVGGARFRRGLEKRLVSMAAGIAAVAVTHADQRAALAEGSSLDGMTGLLNRRSLEQQIDGLIAGAERNGGRLSVVMFDVDDFRHYNQTNGHQQGDEVLRRLATVLRGAVRAEDVVARFGGEEFVVVFPGADKVTAMRLAEQIRAKVEEYPFPFRGLQPLGRVSISGGVATYPEDSRGGRELVRGADQAMLEAKREGRNRVLPAEPSYLT